MKRSNRKKPRSAPLTLPELDQTKRSVLTASRPCSPGDRTSMPWTNSSSVPVDGTRSI
jgi:hypothetical protein